MLADAVPGASALAAFREAAAQSIGKKGKEGPQGTFSGAINEKVLVSFEVSSQGGRALVC